MSSFIRLECVAKNMLSRSLSYTDWYNDWYNSTVAAVKLPQSATRTNNIKSANSIVDALASVEFSNLVMLEFNTLNTRLNR
jgi:hypothetical protein